MWDIDLFDLAEETQCAVELLDHIGRRDTRFDAKGNAYPAWDIAVPKGHNINIVTVRMRPRIDGRMAFEMTDIFEDLGGSGSFYGFDMFEYLAFKVPGMEKILARPMV